MTLVSTAAKGSGGTAASMALLTTFTVSGSAAIIDITGIPATYRDLYLRLITRATSAGASDNILLVINNDNTNNYYRQNLQGRAASPTAQESLAAVASIVIGEQGAATSPAGLFTACELWLPGYSSTVWHKQVMGITSTSEGTASGQQVVYQVGARWASTVAINRLTFTSITAGTLAIGSTLDVYGLNPI